MAVDAAAAAAGIPPLSISAGPSAADGASGGQASSATGDFFFGSNKTNWADVAQSVVPFVIIGGAIYWAMRR